MSAEPPKYWRSLEELAQTPGFEEWLHREFPRGASEWSDQVHRRDFLRLMGASLALAGLGACTKQSIEKIVPYVNQPEEIVPGNPLYFATATTFGGYGQGIVATSHEGRPTKLEGNPDHPASLGATTIWAQADVLDLYDPDRAKILTNGSEGATWGDFQGRLQSVLADQAKSGGAGIRFLTQTVTSPTFAAQMQAIAKKFPGTRWHQWDPLTRDNVHAVQAGGVFGGETVYDFTKAKVIVALDSDFLYLHPAALRHARDFARSRRVTQPTGATMSRFYAAEPTPSITGSNADHRLPLAAHSLPALAAALVALIGAGGAGADVPPAANEWLWAAAQDLRAHAGASIVIAGETQPPEVHALVALINASLGNIGVTITERAPVAANPVNQLSSLEALVEQIQVGEVEMLVILGGNPVYDAPADLEFAATLKKVPLRIHHTLQLNETSASCDWQVPATHFLESWSDVRASDGTVTVVQPLIAPLYEGVSVHELLDVFAGGSGRGAYGIVRAAQQGALPDPTFTKAWTKILSDGVVGATPTTAPASIAPNEPPTIQVAASSRGLELLFRADPNLLDGRYANNGWLQELPHPFSKIAWDNAALVSPALARREKLENGDYLELTYQGRKLDAPVWILPGQAEDTITLHLGYGRQKAGRVGTNRGYNAYTLRTSSALWNGTDLTIRKLAASGRVCHHPESFLHRRARTLPRRHASGVYPPAALRRGDDESAEGRRDALPSGRIQKRGICLGDGDRP